MDCGDSADSLLSRYHRIPDADSTAHCNPVHPTSCLPPLPFILNLATGKPHNLSLAFHSGNTFSWSDGRHQCRHSKPLDTAVSSVVNSECAVLSFFDGMFITPVLSSIVCQHHQCLVPFCELQVHIRNQHKQALTACQWDFSQLLDHIQENSPLSLAKTKEEIRELAARVCLTEPLPGISEPQLCIQCPVCKAYFVSTQRKPGGGIQGHFTRLRPPSASACRDWYRMQKQSFRPSKMPKVYASCLLESRARSTIRVAFSSDYMGTARSPPTPESPILDPGGDLPAYLIEHGWIPYVRAVGARIPALIQLVALPSLRMVDTWPEHSEGYRIEEGLLILSNTLRLYLLTADTRVNSCHDSVRDAIVME